MNSYPYKPGRILLSRTDNLGDVVLTLPMAGMIRNLLPESRVLFLGKTYTKPLIDACSAIDEFVNWDELSELDLEEQANALAALEIDLIIHVFPRSKVARAAAHANIPMRMGTSHRLFHWLHCNRLLHFSRKRSDLHEVQLNLRMLRAWGAPATISFEKIPALYGLDRLTSLAPETAGLLDPNRLNIVIHPKSKGSAREWPLSAYADLIQSLPSDRFKIFATGTAAEGALIREPLLDRHPEITDLTGRLSLEQLIAFLARIDGILACSTGPLHIAAALGRQALGLFAPMRPIHPGRWAPIGTHAEVIVLDKLCQACRKSGPCVCIAALEVGSVRKKLLAWLKLPEPEEPNLQV